MSEPLAKSPSLLFRTKELLRQFDLRAKKGLGQNFLVNSSILKKIIAAAELSSSDIVLEIGPGLGFLTGELAIQAGWVIAVELDPKLAKILSRTFDRASNVSIINQNILDIEPLDLICQKEAHVIPSLGRPIKYKLVANLPYYITAPILRHFCEAKLKPQIMVLMVQKEVARNIVSQPGNMSILALAVQFYGNPQIISYVPARNFYPAPKVDSAILRITLYPSPIVKVTSETSFFSIIRAGFCAARKQIANSLVQGLDMPKAEVLFLLENAEIRPQVRAEQLSLEEWARLERVYSEVRMRK